MSVLHSSTMPFISHDFVPLLLLIPYAISSLNSLDYNHFPIIILDRNYTCYRIDVISQVSRNISPNHIDWIGLRENLQETIDFPIKYGAFLQIFP